MKSHRPQLQVLVAGNAIDALAIRHAPQDYQEELRLARSKFGSALCCCLTPNLPLVIRERDRKLFLAAWPEQGTKHAFGCPFLSEPRPDQPALTSGAVRVDGDITNVQLHHSTRQANRAHHAGQNSQAGGVGADPHDKYARLHLWGLLHYLWDSAGLNRWHSGWHRDWGFVRYAIRRVAQSTLIDAQPLLSSLYVPSIWTPARKQEIQEHWEQFLAPLVQQHRRSPLVACGFVIGAVRQFKAMDNGGYRLALQHHGVPFIIDPWMSKVLAQFSRRGWSALKMLDAPVDGDARPHVIAALRIEASQTGQVYVVEAVLMRVTPRFIPVNSSFEDKVARLLVEQDRQFIRPLHYDHHKANLPDFVLKDAGEGQVRRAVAMHVYGPALGPIRLAQQMTADKASAQDQGMDYWSWNAAKQPQPPPFPDVFSFPPPNPPNSSKEQSP